MAYRKRPREDDTQTNRSNIKRVKSDRRWLENHPPAFWDSLSKVFLTRRALRELDRRNSIDSPPRSQASSCLSPRSRGPLTRGAARTLASHTAQFAKSGEQDRWLARRRGPLTRRTARTLRLRIAQFATSGEQDLSDLRGFSAPPDSTTVMGPKAAPKSSRSSRSSQSKQTSTQSSNTPKSVRSSAYDANFERHFIDNGVYPADHDYGNLSLYPEPGNLSEIRAAMAEPRASLSPSQVTPAQFRSFRIKNKTSSEGTVMRSLIPTITGDKDIRNEGNMPFTNLTSMTNEATVKPVPDFWDGAPPDDLYRTVRDHESLNTKLIPTKHSTAPVVPNFFLEAKAPSGGVDVAQRQAMADGAYGARAMHSLQNYGLDEPVYDGNAYTYSSTYHSGNLKLYGHYATAPTAAGGEPRYHMTQLRGYDLTDSPDTYREAVAALRNTRDLAKRQRDRAITQANARALQSGSSYGEISGHESMGHTTETSQGTNYSAFAYLPPQDDSQHEIFASTSCASADVEASYTTSFTSTTEPAVRSKRISSQSPPEASRRAKVPVPESRTRSDKRKGKGKEVPRESLEDYWTWSSTANNWYHTNEDGSCEWYTAPRKGRSR